MGMQAPIHEKPWMIARDRVVAKQGGLKQDPSSQWQFSRLD